MWYVIRATPGAYLYSGFKQSITPEEYVEKVSDNTFTDTLQRHDVKEGDVFFLPAGRVHAIGAGCFMAEIQQTSNITYRIWDYNRKDAQETAANCTPIWPRTRLTTGYTTRIRRTTSGKRTNRQSWSPLPFLPPACWSLTRPLHVITGTSTRSSSIYAWRGAPL